jgi:hypothetical protein
MSDETPGFLQDERGTRSSARALLWIVVLNAIAIAWADIITADVENAVYAFLSGLITALACGAWGPRVAQYLAPQMAGTARAIGEALRSKGAYARDPKKGIEPTP